MAWTQEQRAKIMATKAANKAERERIKDEMDMAEVARKLREQAKASGAPNIVASYEVPADEKPMPTPANPKAPPKNLFSGFVQKLQVFGKSGDPNDPIPGYKPRWFNDVEGGLRIQTALASGWEFVNKEEVALNDAPATPGNNDLGSHVRRWVGEHQDGSAIYAYLLKKPNWLVELHETGPESREVLHHQRIEAELRRGTFNQQPGEGRYVPTDGRGNPLINLNTRS
jgi:hypothetical protein